MPVCRVDFEVPFPLLHTLRLKIQFVACPATSWTSYSSQYMAIHFLTTPLRANSYRWPRADPRNGFTNPAGDTKRSGTGRWREYSQPPAWHWAMTQHCASDERLLEVCQCCHWLKSPLPRTMGCWSVPPHVLSGLGCSFTWVLAERLLRVTKKRCIVILNIGLRWFVIELSSVRDGRTRRVKIAWVLVILRRGLVMIAVEEIGQLDFSLLL